MFQLAMLALSMVALAFGKHELWSSSKPWDVERDHPGRWMMVDAALPAAIQEQEHKMDGHGWPPFRYGDLQHQDQAMAEPAIAYPLLAIHYFVLAPRVSIQVTIKPRHTAHISCSLDQAQIPPNGTLVTIFRAPQTHRWNLLSNMRFLWVWTARNSFSIWNYTPPFALYWRQSRVWQSRRMFEAGHS